VLVAVWFAVFSLPLFLFTPDAPSRKLPAATAIRLGLAGLVETVRNLRHHGQIARFLLAQMIYSDGLNTLFAFGGIYAAGTFGMDFSEIILFGIAINVTAGLGAFAFAWIDDWIGPKRTILVSLFFLTLLGGALLVVEGKPLFWTLALPLGIFVGPAQAASRSLMAHLAPPGMANEMFGLYSLSGKATAFLGPAALGWATVAFGSQRAGMSAIIVLFLAGALLLAFTVGDPTRKSRAVERRPE
jgi:UMF1 family MFS transporter